MTKFVPALVFALFVPALAMAQTLDAPPANVTITSEQQKEMFKRSLDAVEKALASKDKNEVLEATVRKKTLEGLAAALLLQPKGQANYAQTVVILDSYGWSRTKQEEKKTYFTGAQKEAMLKGGLWLAAYYGQPRFRRADPKGKYSKQILEVLNPLALKVNQGKELTVADETSLLKAFCTVHAASGLLSPSEIAELEKQLRGGRR